jgi:threonine dehydratase
MKLVVEPSSATVVAAVLKDQRFKGNKVCCIISGGNIDMGSFWKNLRQKAKL